jgi:hypothetical protein
VPGARATTIATSSQLIAAQCLPVLSTERVSAQVDRLIVTDARNNMVVDVRVLTDLSEEAEDRRVADALRRKHERYVCSFYNCE